MCPMANTNLQCHFFRVAPCPPVGIITPDPCMDARISGLQIPARSGSKIIRLSKLPCPLKPLALLFLMQDMKTNTQTEKSFFQLQMESIGLDSSNNWFEVPKYTGTSLMGNYDPEFEGAAISEAENEMERHLIFREDKDGNLIIPYFNLYGHVLTAHQNGNKWSGPFERIRLKVPRLDKDGKEVKYESPYKSGNFIYFPPEIIMKFRSRIEIDTLIITEGEKKAVRGCKAGLDVVGVSGIHNFYNDETKQLHVHLVHLLKRCQVKKVFFLTDADTLILKYRVDRDLSTRPNLFFSAWRNFREAILMEMETRKETLSLRDVYVGCIRPEHVDSGKGLDDFLSPKSPARIEAFKEGLKALGYENSSFISVAVLDGTNRLQQLIGLKSAQNFFEVYRDFIGNQEFRYKSNNYQWNEGDEKLELLSHNDLKLFMRIGCDYFKTVRIPSKEGQMEESIKKWKKDEINADYGKHFVTQIPKYDAWCNVPDNSTAYKRIHNGCFNLYNPIPHPVAEGSIRFTLMFLKHLFQGQATAENDIPGDPFTVALDYLTIMYRFPMQKLPVICLVSPENKTGKSTFAWWLRDIYGGNATVIDNERFKQSFNSHYITKFIIAIDEGFLDVDKRAEKERLKKLATDEKQYLEFKGADVQEVDFFAKIIICSNEADSLMKIDDGEVRWFVVRVPTFQASGMKEDPDLREKMRSEIPAFLHFLAHRKIAHPKESRMWIHEQYIMTDQLRTIIENTRNRVERVVEGVICEMFRTYKVNSFYMDIVSLLQIIKRDGESKYAIDQLEIKKFLKEKKGMQPTEPRRLRYPDGFDSHTGDIVWNTSKSARCYHFEVVNWLRDEATDNFSEYGRRALTDDKPSVSNNIPLPVIPAPLLQNQSHEVPF